MRSSKEKISRGVGRARPIIQSRRDEIRIAGGFNHRKSDAKRFGSPEGTAYAPSNMPSLRDPSIFISRHPVTKVTGYSYFVPSGLSAPSPQTHHTTSATPG